MKNSPVYKILEYLGDRAARTIEGDDLFSIIRDEAPETFELFSVNNPTKIPVQFQKPKEASAESIDPNYTQLCVWPGCIVIPVGMLPGSEKAKEKIAEFESFMKEQFNARIKYVEEVKTNPTPGESGTGGRDDLFFYVHTEDIDHFAIPRLQAGIRWWEDVLGNGNGVLYPQSFLDKYPKRW